jgi:hypothetical protein
MHASPPAKQRRVQATCFTVVGGGSFAGGGQATNFTAGGGCFFLKTFDFFVGTMGNSTGVYCTGAGRFGQLGLGSLNSIVFYYI